MSLHFCVSIRFLDAAFHGRCDGGEPEWPPSPLRVLQALVAVAAARGRSETLSAHAQSALMWLGKQTAPILVAPTGVTASSYCLSVPNNAMDIVANAWCRGNDSNSGDANPATHRAMKTVSSTLLLGSDAVHYLWPLDDQPTVEIRGYVETLVGITRSVVALGWGVDMVVGHAAIMSNEESDRLPGERWMPTRAATDDGLRVPVAGTLDALVDRHRQFLARLGPNGLGFTPPRPLSAYLRVGYRRVTDSPPRPVAAFALLKPDARGFRAFDTARRALTVAGMTRHAAKIAAGAAGWDELKINTYILGHGDSKGVAGHVAVGPRRFAYLPLPSLEVRGNGKARVVGSVRRVMLSSFAENCDAEIEWARRSLSGQELVDQDKQQPVALLSLIPENDKIVRLYTRSAASWATVTPLVLPGYDDPGHYRRRLKRGTSSEEQKQLLDRLGQRVDGLLRKAITQGGFSEALAEHAEFEWRKVGFWPGTDLADRYGVPNHLRRFPCWHVRLHWRDGQGRPVQVPGPVCLGGGRFYGLGLFAAFHDG